MENEVFAGINSDTQTGNSWDTFAHTGNIEAYLLYKWAAGFYDDDDILKDKDDTWHQSELKGLS